jgi:ABC-2 type transport system ATP-binding protein
MPDPAIELRGVVRPFGTVRAVNGLDLVVPAGSVAVLLGPNGAGKTTTVRLITGALKVDSGRLRVLGLSPWQWELSPGYSP